MTTEKVAWERNALTKIFFLQHSAFVFPSRALSSLLALLVSVPRVRVLSTHSFRKLALLLDLVLFVSGASFFRFVRSFVFQKERPRRNRVCGGALPRMESPSIPALRPSSSPVLEFGVVSRWDSLPCGGLFLLRVLHPPPSTKTAMIVGGGTTTTSRHSQINLEEEGTGEKM